jgi:hypothetical protein
VSFNLEQYKQRTERLRWDDLDFGAFKDHPLSADVLRCIRYMHDVEYHTVCYLRDLLVTPAHQDPEVTAFLSFWAFEEFWHGEALAEVLSAHQEESGEKRVGAVRSRLGWGDKLRPVLMSMGGWLAQDDFIAVHMAWGAVNEWTAQSGYGQLARRASHPVLAELLARIMRQEGRHIDFYATQAKARLATGRRARWLARTALSRWWNPVGADLMPASELAFASRYLFGDDQGRQASARVDRQIDRLPGLEGLHLLSHAIEGFVEAA